MFVFPTRSKERGKSRNGKTWTYFSRYCNKNTHSNLLPGTIQGKVYGSFITQNIFHCKHINFILFHYFIIYYSIWSDLQRISVIVIIINSYSFIYFFYLKYTLGLVWPGKTRLIFGKSDRPTEPTRYERHLIKVVLHPQDPSDSGTDYTTHYPSTNYTKDLLRYWKEMHDEDKTCVEFGELCEEYLEPIFGKGSGASRR